MNYEQRPHKLFSIIYIMAPPKPKKVKKGKPPPIDKLIVPAVGIGLALLGYQFFKGLTSDVSVCVAYLQYCSGAVLTDGGIIAPSISQRDAHLRVQLYFFSLTLTLTLAFTLTLTLSSTFALPSHIRPTVITRQCPR